MPRKPSVQHGPLRAYNIVLLLVQILACAYSYISAIPEPEVLALLQFKAGITSFNMSKPQSLGLRAWNVSNTKNICESWVGVTCTVDGGDHVAEINLAGYGLVGSIPPHLGNLTFLSTLNLSDNHLTGPIPPQLSGCTPLRVLDLNGNDLTGPIPSSLGSLSSLLVLRLCHNHLSGLIPSSLFMNVTSLIKLSLCDNSLTGSISIQEAWQLPSLQLFLLWGNKLTGPLPRSFNNCESIIDLDLNSNHLTGEVPIGLPPNIQTLNLGDNNLTGSIPASLSNFTHLIDLELKSNQLTGFIPTELGDLIGLSYLVLSENYLTGSIPSSLGRCQYLLEFHLNSNQLTGPIPLQLGLLYKLQWLKLNDNSLTGPIPPSLGNCSSLKDLSLFSNQLDGPIPPELGALPALLNLHLYENNLEGIIPSAIANCTNLSVLQLSNNRLTGPIPIEFGLLPFLSILMLDSNSLTENIPSSLGNCSQLRYLGLPDNQLSGNIPTEIFSMLAHLQHIYLYQNNLSGFNPLSFRNFTSLIDLQVQRNHLAGAIPSELGQLPGLQLLDMSDNHLSGEIPWGSLSNCSSLFHIDFSQNYLSGGITSYLGKIRQLSVLYLKGNFLQGTMPTFERPVQLSFLEINLSFNSLNGSLSESLAQMLGRVQSLDLSHNQFNGVLPSWLGDLMMVQSMDLSSNNFDGSIPESLSNCLGLSALNLSHNNLIGQFPLHLDSIPYLQLLDLSSNKLTGLIPSYLENLQNLQFLNVSFNSFTGSIPVLGVFQHLNASSFLGNPGLCGRIIQKSCKSHHHLKRKAVLYISLAGCTLMLVLVALLYFCHLCKGVRDEHLQCFGTKHYTAEELIAATQGYSETNLVGEGALGIVYRANLSDGEVVAVKKFKEGCSRESLLQEVQILGKLRHRNLVRVLGCVLNLEVAALVLEFMSNGSVEQFLHHTSNESYSLSWDMFDKIAIGVANALGYMHHEYGVPIIHGDVKPSNILLDSDFEPHLADFGLAKLIKAGAAVSLSSSFKGSIGYMAPEYAYATRVTTKVDVFSFGVVLLEMLTGRRPTDLELHGVSLHEWVKGKLCDGLGVQEVLHASLLQSSSSQIEMSLNVTDDHKVISLLRMAVSCTEDYPSNRPTMQEVLAFLTYREKETRVHAHFWAESQNLSL